MSISNSVEFRKILNSPKKIKKLKKTRRLRKQNHCSMYVQYLCLGIMKENGILGRNEASLKIHSFPVNINNFDKKKPRAAHDPLFILALIEGRGA